MSSHENKFDIEGDESKHDLNDDFSKFEDNTCRKFDDLVEFEPEHVSPMHRADTLASEFASDEPHVASVSEQKEHHMRRHLK